MRRPPGASLRLAFLRAGLQGKLVLSFMGMLAIAIGISAELFLARSSEVLDALVERQAVELVRAMVTAAEPSLKRGDESELVRLEQDMLKHQNVLASGFLDKAGHRLSMLNEDLLLDDQSKVSPLGIVSTGLLPLQRGSARASGRFVTVCAPVFAPAVPDPSRTRASRLLGYATVSLSGAEADAQMDRTRLHVVLIGALAVLGCLPVAWVLIYKIFDPIRRLVAATDCIAAGDLETQVEIDRTDIIGTLARSFNLMVARLRDQREALATANRELESKVLQRTAQLEAANTRLSHEIAEKEDFLRAVSHDLNAPLRNIAGMAMMLMRKSQTLDPEVLHRLERIQKNVEIETDLIAELLELSRIKTRRLKMERVDMRRLVKEVSGMFEEDLRAGNIRFTIDGDLPRVQCEKSRMRQVFQNLIDNAIKYMGAAHDRPREIRVGCVARSEEVEFYVLDTGIGIDAEDLSRIFHIFRRGTNARASDVPGKGIGLASVKSIVETYNGTIWAESRVGQGATLRFTINGKYILDASAHEEAADEASPTGLAPAA